MVVVARAGLGHGVREQNEVAPRLGDERLLEQPASAPTARSEQPPATVDGVAAVAQPRRARRFAGRPRSGRVSRALTAAPTRGYSAIWSMSRPWGSSARSTDRAPVPHRQMAKQRRLHPPPARSTGRGSPSIRAVRSGPARRRRVVVRRASTRRRGAADGRAAEFEEEVGSSLNTSASCRVGEVAPPPQVW